MNGPAACTSETVACVPSAAPAPHSVPSADLVDMLHEDCHAWIESKEGLLIRIFYVNSLYFESVRDLLRDLFAF